MDIMLSRSLHQRAHQRKLIALRNLRKKQFENMKRWTHDSSAKLFSSIKGTTGNHGLEEYMQ